MSNYKLQSLSLITILALLFAVLFLMIGALSNKHNAQEYILLKHSIKQCQDAANCKMSIHVIDNKIVTKRDYRKLKATYGVCKSDFKL